MNRIDVIEKERAIHTKGQTNKVSMVSRVKGSGNRPPNASSKLKKDHEREEL